jgi:uncharacterized protein YdcH (DUF465 family)
VVDESVYIRKKTIASMSNQSSPLSRISELKAQIARLQDEAVRELREKRKALADELASVDAQLSELTGSSAAKSGPRARVGTGKSVPLQDLKALLEAAPDKTLNIRKEGLELANIKTLASANPHLLRLGGKGAWPTVTMLK